MRNPVLPKPLKGSPLSIWYDAWRFDVNFDFDVVDEGPKLLFVVAKDVTHGSRKARSKWWSHCILIETIPPYFQPTPPPLSLSTFPVFLLVTPI